MLLPISPLASITGAGFVVSTRAARLRIKPARSGWQRVLSLEIALCNRDFSARPEYASRLAKTLLKQLATAAGSAFLPMPAR